MVKKCEGGKQMMRTRSLRLFCAVAASAYVLLSGSIPAQSQDQKARIALPTTSIGFAYAYVAEALGFWKDQGLDVTVSTITGLNATNALLAGNVEFSGGSGGTLLLAVSRGQKLVSIANLHNRLLVELVLGNEAISRTGLSENSSVADRAKALKGMTIAIDFVNSIIHGYLKYVLLSVGLDPERDVTVSPISPIGMMPALQSKRVDGYVMVPPWTSAVVPKQAGKVWVSAVRGDLPELMPFAFDLVLARQGYCDQNRTICEKFGAGINRAFAFIRNQPEKTLAVLRERFKDMDPELLNLAFEVDRAILPEKPLMTTKAMEIAQDFNIKTGLMKPEDKIAPLGPLYTNDFVN